MELVEKSVVESAQESVEGLVVELVMELVEPLVEPLVRAWEEGMAIVSLAQPRERMRVDGTALMSEFYLVLVFLEQLLAFWLVLLTEMLWGQWNSNSQH